MTRGSPGVRTRGLGQHPTQAGGHVGCGRRELPQRHLGRGPERSAQLPNGQVTHQRLPHGDADLAGQGVGTARVACLVQDRLRLNCPAFDLQAACAGFAYALITAAQFVAAGTSRRALVIGGEPGP